MKYPKFDKEEDIEEFIKSIKDPHRSDTKGKKDCMEYLISAGIYNREGNIAENYK